MKILVADFVVPVTSKPISGGAVVIDGDVIAAVGPAADVKARYADAQVVELGRAAILPGLVNCHSHLEITGMRGALDHVEHDFAAWLTTLTSIRASMSDDEIMRWAITGASEGASAGVTCFADIGRMGKAGMEALRTSGLRGMVFQETEFSPVDSDADQHLADLKRKTNELRRSETNLVKVGLSPHAPYTVSATLFSKITEWAEVDNLKVSIHASESVDETRFLQDGSGTFGEIYKNFGISWSPPGCSPIEHLDRTGILRTRPLLAHCVTVTRDDIIRMSDRGATVAHCPKSNAKFAHGYAPVAHLLEAGVQVGLGSDSVASNNLCDLLEESRFASFAARNHPSAPRFVSATEALELATVGGARALQMDHQIGSLEAGKQADITVVDLSHIAQQPVTDVTNALVFSSTGRDVVLTMVAGREVYRRSY
jgi:aminodeoxyfutalosine deaminase